MSDDQTTQACTEIYAWIDSELGRKEVGTANRCSSAPQCVRKRWLQNQGVVGEPMQPRSLLVFATGDVVEHVYKYFIAKACVGPGRLYSEVDFGTKDGTFTIQHREFDIYRQEQLVIDLPGITITGSPDGWGKRESDGQWELIEIKSASSYGFDDFVAGETEYLKQVHALLLSQKAKDLGAKSARFFYMNKNTSAVFDRLYQFDSAVAKEVMREYAVAAGGAEPSIPEYLAPVEETYYKKPTGKTKLHWKCSYCDYRARCWPQAQIEFKSGKPVYYLKKDGTNGGA